MMCPFHPECKLLLKTAKLLPFELGKYTKNSRIECLNFTINAHGVSVAANFITIQNELMFEC